MKMSIPNNLYGAELRTWINSLCLEHPDKKEVQLLGKVLRAYIDDTFLKVKTSFIGNINLSEDERNIVEMNSWLDCENIEVKARFIDLMIRYIRGAKRLEAMRESSACYFAVAECIYHKRNTNLVTHEYLIRGVRVCVAKQLYDNGFVNRIGKLIVKCNINPSWTIHILKTIIENLSSKNKTVLFEIINKHFENRSIDDLSYKDQYIEYLWQTKQINKFDYDYMKALNCESIANKIITERAPNSFYPMIQDYYQKAFNHIAPYKSIHIDEYNRIKEEFEKANKEATQMLMKYGVHIKYTCDEKCCNYIDEQISKEVIHNSVDSLRLFVNTPIFAVSSVLVKQVKSTIAQYDILRSIANTIQYDEKGHIIGKNSVYEYPDIEAHKYLRTSSLYYLGKIIHLSKKEQINIDEELVDILLKTKKPDFVSEEDIIFWRTAILSALKGDYITASHVIMPQLEKSLRNIAATMEDTVHLDNERQDEHNLAEILADLKPHMNQDLNNELKYFLITGTDVNYRNKLLHGLIKPFEINLYGPYLICISLKLFFDRDFLKEPYDTKGQL